MADNKTRYGLIGRVLRPFKIIPMHRAAFFLWFLFTILGGMVGIIISVIRHVLFDDFSLFQALFIETSNGSFYTYSIAIVASVLSMLFVLFVEKDMLSFRSLQIPTTALAVFILLFGGVFYALNIDLSGQAGIENIKAIEHFSLDWKQLGIIIVSLLFSIYTFCLARLDDHKNDFDDISDVSNSRNSLEEYKEIDVRDNNE